jgi:hypothetical protein
MGLNKATSCIIFVLALIGGVVATSQQANRVDASWDALVNWFSLSNEPGLFMNDLPTAPQRRLAFVWPHSQIMEAALMLPNRTWYNLTLRALELYLLTTRSDSLTAYAPPIHPVQNESRYWDDNGVAGLALIRGGFYENAQRIWPFVKSGQNSNGGVYWHERDTQPQRGISATGSDSELALHLFLHGNSKDMELLNWAKKNLGWLRTHLLATEGYYYNSWFDKASDVPKPCQTVPNKPNVCSWMFTYNQGFVISTLVLMYEATQDKSCLAEATDLAKASLQNFTPDSLWKQPPPFNSIFFRSLLKLNDYAPDPQYQTTFQDYLTKAWNIARDPTTGLFTKGGIGTYDVTFGSIDQAAFVLMFGL